MSTVNRLCTSWVPAAILFCLATKGLVFFILCMAMECSSIMGRLGFGNVPPGIARLVACGDETSLRRKSILKRDYKQSF